MRIVKQGSIKKVLGILWKHRAEIAGAILMLADYIAETAKKDREAERVQESTNNFAD